MLIACVTTDHTSNNSLSFANILSNPYSGNTTPTATRNYNAYKRRMYHDEREWARKTIRKSKPPSDMASTRGGWRAALVAKLLDLRTNAGATATRN